MKGEFNLPQALLWIVSQSRPFGSANEVGAVIANMATGRSTGSAPSLLEAFCKLQSRFGAGPNGGLAPLSEAPKTVTTRFGEATSAGHEAAELWADAMTEFLEAIRNGSLRAYGRRNGVENREIINPIAASSARLVDHDGPMLVPTNFPVVDEPRWSDVTCEIVDVVKIWSGRGSSCLPVAPLCEKGKTGPKAVVFPRVLEEMRNYSSLAELKNEQMTRIFKAGAGTVSKAKRQILAERTLNNPER